MEQYVHTYDSYGPGQRALYVPTVRIQVRNNVFLPASEVDMDHSYLQPDRLRRRRTQGMKLEQERLNNEEKKLRESLARENAKGGVRISRRLMVWIIIVSAFLCGCFWLNQQSIMMKNQQSIDRQNKEINRTSEENDKVQADIDEACSESKICYQARNLNLIRSDEVSAIYLTAEDTRPMGENTEAENRLAAAMAVIGNEETFDTVKADGAKER